MWVGMELSWGLVGGVNGIEGGEVKNVLFGGASGIPSLFQDHSPGGTTAECGTLKYC